MMVREITKNEMKNLDPVAFESYERMGISDSSKIYRISPHASVEVKSSGSTYLFLWNHIEKRWMGLPTKDDTVEIPNTYRHILF